MQVVERLIERAAFRSEAALSAVRIVFCLGLVVRFFGSGLSDAASDGALLAAVTLPALPVVFSVVVIYRFKIDHLSMSWLAASVLLDAMLSTSGLFTTVVHPESDYRGILHTPDTAGVLVVMMATGLRLSVRLAVLGIVSNCIGLVLLVVGDHTLCPMSDLDYSLSTIMMWPVFITGAAAFALLSAWRTRSLATHGAVESLRLERACNNLRALLHGHHDAHALLSSVTLNTDLLIRDPAFGPETRQLAEELRKDVALLKDCVQGLKQQAHGELIVALDPAEVSFDDQVEQISTRLRAQLGAVELSVRTDAPRIRAAIAGGAQGLTRILLNLLVNARDAAGNRKTTRIWLETSTNDGYACLSVKDDGPGFLDDPGTVSTTKLEGMGVGLSIVAAISEASGGSVRLSKNRPHGASVDVRFPTVSAPMNERPRTCSSELRVLRHDRAPRLGDSGKDAWKSRTSPLRA